MITSEFEKIDLSPLLNILSKSMRGETFVESVIRDSVLKESDTILSKLNERIKEISDAVSALDTPITYDSSFFNKIRVILDDFILSIRVGSSQNALITALDSANLCYRVMIENLNALVEPAIYKREWSELFNKFSNFLIPLISRSNNQTIKYFNLVGLLIVVKMVELNYYSYFCLLVESNKKTKLLSDELIENVVYSHKDIFDELFTKYKTLIANITPCDIMIMNISELNNISYNLRSMRHAIHERSRFDTLVHEDNILRFAEAPSHASFSKEKFVNCETVLIETNVNIKELSDMISDDSTNLEFFNAHIIIATLSAAMILEKYLRYYFGVSV